MTYRLQRHITNTLLYAAIITALVAITKQYTRFGALVFAIVSIALLAADRIVENRHLKQQEQKEAER
jgi:NADH:ubiquinone oxidoreductase subunit K